MKHLFLLIPIFLFCVVANCQVILYENHFETPNSPPVANCAPDFDATFVNILWGGTGTGTGGGGSFTQSNTVETILINGPANQYNDPSLTGGNYSIGMLSALQDDKLALTLNSQGYPYINVSFDLSAIGVNGCGVFGAYAVPEMNIKLYDSPTGTFSFGSPGTLLDEKNVSGTSPSPDIYTFNWAAVGAFLSNSASGFITVVFDLTTSTYASFDNLKIVSAAFPLPLKLIFFNAAQLSNHNVELKWQTIDEIGFKEFDIEKSDDGISFRTIKTVAAKLSTNENNYGFIDNSVWNANKKYYRLRMIDLDGRSKYSRIIVSNKVTGIIEILPNPAKDIISIYGLNGTGKILLSTIDGKILLNKTVNSPSHHLNISNLPNGIYLLKYQNGNGVTFLKLLKQ